MSYFFKQKTTYTYFLIKTIATIIILFLVNVHSAPKIPSMMDLDIKTIDSPSNKTLLTSNNIIDTIEYYTEESKAIVQACDKSNSKNYFIYCYGKIISAVNHFSLYKDSKTFVDKPMKSDPHTIVKKFEETFPDDVEKINIEKLQNFIDQYFDKEGEELESCILDEWHEEPSHLNKIKDKTLRAWSYDLNKIWKKLCRRMKYDVKINTERYSLLYVPNPFIVPGGRFREFYYWDVYWIIKGLIASGLLQTTKYMLSNFAYIVETHGFIPNGGRVYYLQRSQPPMFIPMVYEYYEASRNVTFLKEILPTLEKELHFWETKRSIQVNINGSDYVVYQYRAESNVPRPEAYKEDFNLVKNISNEHEKRRIYRDLASAAESGWDFSNRWFKDIGSLSTIQTTNIIPVDLNAFICWNYRLLSYLFSTIGDERKHLHYWQKYVDFIYVFKKVFHVKEHAGWFDYNLETKKHNLEFYLSIATPLFTGCYEELDLDLSAAIFNKLEKLRVFEYAGGVPVSLIKDSTQQWDYPNGWSPLNHMLIEGLRQAKNARMQQKAYSIAEKWVLNNFRVYKATKFMWEKYNVIQTQPDKGSGGEYDVQEGFGWSNGAVLDLLRIYSDRLQFDGLIENIDKATQTNNTRTDRFSNDTQTNSVVESETAKLIDNNTVISSSAISKISIQRIIAIVSFATLIVGYFVF